MGPSKSRHVCALCRKEVEGYPYSWEAFVASPRKKAALLAFQCAGCGEVYCSDCRARALKFSAWDGWERVKCPACERAFGPGRVFFEPDLTPEEIQKATEYLVAQVNYSADEKNVPRMADALADFGDPGIEALLSLIDPGGKGVTSTGFTESARVLSKSGEPRAAQRLRSVLAGNPDSKIDLTNYRMISADHLARVDPGGAAPLLADILVNEREPIEIRQKVAQVLGATRRSESVPGLIKVLGDLKWARAGLVATAAEALGRIGDRRAVEPLITALAVSNLDARAKVAEALGALDDPRAIEPLKAHLGAGHHGLRQAAAKALESLHWKPADEKEQALRDGSLPVEEERLCPACDQPAGDAKSCPNCGAELTSKPFSPALAGLLGYLFGGLMGGVGLLIVVLLGAALKLEVDTSVRMIVFAIFAIGAWGGMKARLSTPRDLAVLKPRRTGGPPKS